MAENVFSTPLTVCNDPPAPGPAGAPVPLANPLTLDTPGRYYFQFPPGTGTITVETWGGGAAGNGGSSTGAGGDGGGSGAYAKFTMGEGLFTNGAYLLVEVGSGGGGAGGAGGNTYCLSQPSNIGLNSHGGQADGSHATNQVTAGAGLAVTTNTVGGAGVLHAADNGGNGGTAPAGGAGGLGATIFAPGDPGAAPGGGGGGGHVGSWPGGAGAPGRVTITRP